MNNSNVFIELETELEEQIKHALLTFQNLTVQQLTHTQGKGSWSISQCIQHLNSYGDYYLPLLDHEIKIRKKAPPNMLYKSSWIGNYFVKKIDPKQSLKKLKAIKKHLPDTTIPPHKIISTHLNQQESLLAYLRAFAHLNLGGRTIPTSLTSLVKINVIDTLRFLVAHNSRHIIQASKIHNTPFRR